MVKPGRLLRQPVIHLASLLILLFFIIQRHTPIGNNKKLLAYSEDILQGLKYVHQQGIVHADIKLENILKQTSEVEEEYDIVKLCDFGLSNKMDANGKINMGKTGT